MSCLPRRAKAVKLVGATFHRPLWKPRNQNEQRETVRARQTERPSFTVAICVVFILADDTLPANPTWKGAHLQGVSFGPFLEDRRRRAERRCRQHRAKPQCGIATASK